MRNRNGKFPETETLTYFIEPLAAENHRENHKIICKVELSRKFVLWGKQNVDNKKKEKVKK